MPLSGKTVGVTREASRAEALAGLIRERGGLPVSIPVIEIVDPCDWTGADAAIDALDSYDILVFTSVNAAERFLGRLRARRGNEALISPSVAAIGTKTGAALESLGVVVRWVPKKPAAAEELSDLLASEARLSGKRVLFPRAAEGREVLIEVMRGAGAHVDLVWVYKTRLSSAGEAVLRQIAEGAPLDWLTFASGSAVAGFSALCDKIHARDALAKRRIRVAALGRVTAGALRDFGMACDVVAARPTMEAMVEAMDRFGGEDGDEG